MTAPARWIDKDGNTISCKDKLSTLDENLAEMLDIALEALEDAAVMGVDVTAARQVFLDEIAALQPRFSGSGPSSAAVEPTSDGTGTVAPASTDHAEN